MLICSALRLFAVISSIHTISAEYWIVCTALEPPTRRRKDCSARILVNSRTTYSSKSHYNFVCTERLMHSPYSTYSTVIYLIQPVLKLSLHLTMTTVPPFNQIKYSMSATFEIEMGQYMTKVVRYRYYRYRIDVFNIEFFRCAVSVIDEISVILR